MGRRSVLKLGGATMVAMLGTGVASASEDYDVVTVSAGDTYSVDLSDGDVLENTLIDITASGARYSIVARGDDWTIRNVGVRGTFDDRDNTSQLNVATDGGSGLVENVYLPGASSPGHSYDGKPGIYVDRSHAGEITIRNVNVKRQQDNGIYASSPGHDASSANGGIVCVEDSYFEANATSNIRLGTTGSYAENCVMKDCLHRGFWAYYESPQIRNCDIFGSGRADIQLGGNSHDKQNYVEVTAENSCWETAEHAGSDTTLNGESAGQPQDRMPEGCPTSAEEAASGNGSSGESGNTNDADSSSVDDAQSLHTLSVQTQAGGPLVEYEFVVEGTVRKAEGAESSDQISASDGTTTVTGVTGNGYADAFEFEGELVDWTASVDAAHYTVTLDGEDVDPAQIGQDSAPSKTLVVETQEGGPIVGYEFVVEGTVQKGTSAESSDQISESDGTTTVTGVTGNGYTDEYEVEGDVVDWTATVDVDHYAVTLDGEELDPAQFRDEPVGPQTLVIDTQEGGPLVGYEFTVEGTVEGTDATENMDRAYPSGDTTTVTGMTGNGYTDEYVVEGELVDWKATVDADHYTVTLDDVEVTLP